MYSVSDDDLRSLQQARDMLQSAHKAWQEYAHFTQEQVDRVVGACAKAASEGALELAKLAVEETGYGVVEHKFVKNKFAADDVYSSIRDMKTVGIVREIPERRVYEIAEPVGVIAAVVPSTNPTSTTIYKILIALKSRNGIVLSPHPSAKQCILKTADVMKRAALQAGAPEGIVDCLSEVSLDGTRELMGHKRTALILATGGMGLVRAAYSSGKPAFGVGPGNVPAYVEASADVSRAVQNIMTGKSFDNGTLCCSEQSLICDRAVERSVREEVLRQGGVFVSSDQVEKLSQLAVLPSNLANPKIVGKSASFIAEQAGLTVPSETRVLVVALDGVGKEYPLSVEKLSPILSFYVVSDWKEGCERAKEILHYGGMGHTMAIHSSNDDIIREFALQKPASRIIANSSATHGAVGFSTGLEPAMTLGCGSYGGNITSDNITPFHLLNIKRLAYEIRGVDIAKAIESYGYQETMTTKTEPASPITTVPAQEHEPLETRVSEFLKRRGVLEKGFSEVPVASSEMQLPESSELSVPDREALEFVSEDDVRSALHDGRRLCVNSATLITPSAREFGNEHDIFLEV